MPFLYPAVPWSFPDRPWSAHTSVTVHVPEDELEEKAHVRPGGRHGTWPRKYSVLDNWSTVCFEGKRLQVGKFHWTCGSLTLGEGSSLNSAQAGGAVPQA